MKKKILKIVALTLAIVLIAGVCIFANSLVGNPISKALARNTADKYIEETYGDTDYELERVTYSFKDGYYHAFVSSPSSVDGGFTLLINGFGKLQYDNYESDVTSGWNTATRLDADYRKTIDTIFDSSAFPYNVYIGYGELMFATNEYKDAPDVPDYALITEELTLNAYYDVNELGAKAGKLTVYIDDATVSAERMAEILLGVRECFDSAGVGFYAIDCVLEYPRPDGGVAEDGRVEVMDFLYSDIYEEGLVERVEASNEAANAYYSSQDAEKLNGQQ
ncbi:MAG: hypothetical protein IJY39_09340 [Clostridia bacterium]|nr:hypothetical protein [Clostridia bacterium]